MVNEDTLGPGLDISILAVQGNSLKAGSYTIQATLAEQSGGNLPKITIKDSTGMNVVMGLFMTSAGQSSNAYTYQFTLTNEVPAGPLSIQITGFDEYGNSSPGNDYNSDGKLEIAHTDPIYLALFTSWVNDWLLGGDIDYGYSGPGNGDGIIGGYDWIDADEDGNVDGGKWFDADSNGIVDPGENEMVSTQGEPGDSEWGDYNEYGVKEVGNAKSRSISNELDRLVHNFGMEYWYGKYFAIRTGLYYDKTGKISNPTFGIGLRFAGYGFDFGYTYGEQGHPLTNTMRFSLNMEF